MQCFGGESLFGKGRSTCKGPGAGIYLGSSCDWNRMREGERERGGEGREGMGQVMQGSMGKDGGGLGFHPGRVLKQFPCLLWE